MGKQEEENREKKVKMTHLQEQQNKEILYIQFMCAETNMTTTKDV